MRASASLLIPIILFSNFFGGFISETLQYLNTGYFIHGVWDCASEYYLSAIFDCSCVFCVLVIFYKINLTILKQRHVGIAANNGNIIFSKASNVAISTIMLLFSLYFIITTDWSFDIAGRGVDQFVRDQGDNFKRLASLFLPLLLFYYLNFHDKKSRFIFWVSVFCALLADISTGGRATISFLVIVLAFVLLRDNKLNIKDFIACNISLLLSIVIVYLLLMFWRIIGQGDEIGSFIVRFWDSTFGAVGCSQILAVIKYYVDSGLELDIGETFVNAIVSLFVPSFLLNFIFGFSDLKRSSLLFNDVFNNNPNQGYDFSLLADYYWNFGYAGYALFVISIIFMMFIVQKNENSKNNFLFGISIILTYCILQGVRRDFGAFVKLSVYYPAFYWLLYVILPKIKMLHATCE